MLHFTLELSGLNSCRRRLSDGTLKTYYYAYKGGPRLKGEPGDPEFIASFNEAVARKLNPPCGYLQNILTRFEDTQEFQCLADRTKADYKRIIDLKIAAEFSDFPIAGLTDNRARGVLKDWRDRLALKSPRQGDYAWVVLSRILSVAVDRGWIEANPCQRGGRLYRGSRRDTICTSDDEHNFLDKAPAHLHLALLMALWTGQREG